MFLMLCSFHCFSIVAMVVCVLIHFTIGLELLSLPRILSYVQISLNLKFLSLFYCVNVSGLSELPMSVSAVSGAVICTRCTAAISYSLPNNQIQEPVNDPILSSLRTSANQYFCSELVAQFPLSSALYLKGQPLTNSLFTCFRKRLRTGFKIEM